MFGIPRCLNSIKQSEFNIYSLNYLKIDIYIELKYVSSENIYHFVDSVEC